MKKPHPSLLILSLLLARIPTGCSWGTDIFRGDDDGMESTHIKGWKEQQTKPASSPKKGGSKKKKKNPWKQDPRGPTYFAPPPAPSPSPPGQTRPTPRPTNPPQQSPTGRPILNPTKEPVSTPSFRPTISRTFNTQAPALRPLQVDSSEPTVKPVVSVVSTRRPTPFPTRSPSEPPVLDTTVAPVFSIIQDAPTRAPNTSVPVPTANPPSPTVPTTPSLEPFPPTFIPQAPGSTTASDTTRQPTAQESSTACATQGNTFGSSDGDPRFLDYGYELETRPDEILGSISGVVLPPLEVAFNNYLLPEFFPQECGNDVATTSTRRRRLRIVGISAVPADEPQPEIPCKGTVMPGNSCVFVRGSLMLFVDENENAQILDERLRNHLKLGMDSNETMFLSAHPGIVRITYVETNTNEQPTISPEADFSREIDADGIDSSTSDSDNDIILPVVLGSTACIIIAVGAVVARRFSQ